MPESWGCGLYTSAAYTRVFTVLTLASPLASNVVLHIFALTGNSNACHVHTEKLIQLPKKGMLSNKCHFIVIKRTRNLCVIIAGLLAVGSTDGLVKVFCLQVFPSINGIAQYVLWGDKDDMQVQWINWLHSPQVC